MPEKCIAKCKDGSDCDAYPVTGEDKCRMHLGKRGDSHDGNQNAAKHGAYSKSFVTDFLTDDEIARVEDAQELLGTPEGAQDHGRLMAAIAVEQFRRTGDDRFLRRYESICDKFGIAPADEVEVRGEMSHTLEDGFDIVFGDE